MPELFQRHTFAHGIHPPEFKEITRHLPIRRFPFAPFLVLLLSQHAGKPARPIVRERQEVRRGEPVAEADGFVSAPIHAPAAGIIRKIGHALDTEGRMAPAMKRAPQIKLDRLCAVPRTDNNPTIKSGQGNDLIQCGGIT